MFFCVAVFVLVLRTVLCSIDHLDTEVQHQCMQRCPLQNRTDVGHYDLGCGYECNVVECTKGCKLWKQALQSSCKTACNGTSERLPQKQLYCVMGCNDAVASYFAQLRISLGTPPPPALVADSLTATSLKLEWNFPEAEQAALSYLLQWRYEELAMEAAWQFCRNQTWITGNTVFVNGLQPYTKYRFRVALLLGHHSDPIVSAHSVVISTLASGVPASPPAIVRAVPIDSTRVSVSWEPGPFPHGPLLSYVLRITENHPQGYTALKDIPPENNFYMFQNLEPNRNYTVSVSMRNSVGLGPATQVLVSTPPPPTEKNAEQPILIIASQHVVIQQGTNSFDEPVRLYNTEHFIKGIAVHIARKLLFVSDSTRSVYRMPLRPQTKPSEKVVILTSAQINCIPLDLSVDWLNNQLYILCEVRSQQQKVWQIVRSDMDGKGLTVAIAGLRSKPHHIEVDPYNGFLFWSADNHPRPKVGLYRLDLANISNGVKHDVNPKLLLQEDNLGAFTVDYAKYRLIVSSEGKNTVNSVSFDGSEVINLRPNINKSRFKNVLSLAISNDKFYWPDGTVVYNEEYHPMCNCYYHNTYPYLNGHSYNKVIVNLPSAQPIPVPVNPPTSVQAIFGTYLAKTSWQPPHLLGFQGKGAWQNWSYNIEVKNLKQDEAFSYSNISSTSYTITNLDPDTEYLIKVAAYANGRGPWSSEFKGTSLRVPKDDSYPVILWSASEGLLKSDATGENVQSVLHKSMMRSFFFTNVASYKDILYLVTNTSQIYWYNTTTHKHGQLVDIESVQSVAIDWIGKKLYWSNPKQQLIIRGNLNGTQQEPLPILTFAKELNVDAVQAYLYWSTGYAVECAHLNGADRLVYHNAELFTGRKVVGLTLDMDYKYVYWIVRGSEGSNLYKAPMAGYQNFDTNLSEEMVSSLQKPNMQGPLCYFNNRLLWLQDNKNAAISDLNGKNVAKISGKSMSGLTMVSIVDAALHIWPNTSTEFDDEITTIPEAVDETTIKVSGSWESFNITWSPIQNVNFGTVFYEISIKNEIKNESTITEVTTDPFISYPQEIQPFTRLHVSIRAFTYWGSSSQVQAEVYSPPSTPSAPCNLRAYVTHTYLKKGTRVASVTFRWDRPKHSNGVIEGYKIYYWNLNETEAYRNITLPPSDFQFNLSDLQENETYYLQVQAFTAIGFGDTTDVISANTTIESPLPTLLIASGDSISIQDVDVDKNYTLLHGITPPTEISYIIKEGKIFWINELNELRMFNQNNSTKFSKVLDVNSNVTSITIDWVERSLYFVQIKSSPGSSVISKIDLNYRDRGVTRSIKVLERDAFIAKLEVSPFTRKLYWTEMQYDGSYRLMKSSTNGSNIQPFFNQELSSNKTCDCAWSYSLQRTFAVDHSNIVQKPILIFIDSDTYNVMSADKDGCRCSVVAENSITSDSRPIHTLKSDFKMLYWTNLNEKMLYSFEKNDDQILKRTKVFAQDMLIYGLHMHPYPLPECLVPLKDEGISVSLKKKRSHFLILNMPEYKLGDNCPDISIASVEYTVYYKRYTEDDTLKYNSSCQSVRTFNKTLKIHPLQPFSKYVFFVSISNYYADLREEEALIGPGVVFETAVGMPSEPRDVKATVLNPTKVEVQWLRPKELNGRTVSYLIDWETEVIDFGIRQTGEQKVFEHSEMSYKAVLHNLSPNVTYSIWVRACSETNESCSDSKKVHITTFPEPQKITLLSKTAYSLKVQWAMASHIENYTMQYSEIRRFENWMDIDRQFITEDEEEVVADLNNLEPKTQYKLRLSLWYPKYDQEYIWPSETRYIFETEGDRPSPPGIPNVQHVKGDVYQVWWEPAKDNGSPVTLYLLEGLKLPVYRAKRNANRTAWYHNAPSVEEPEIEWESFYNGSDTSWIMSGLSDKYKYSFRVSALNSYGWSDPSEESMEFDIHAASQIAEKQDPTSLILVAICVPVVFFVLFIICFLCCRWRCQRDKKLQQGSITARGPDAELATLRELPRRGNFIHNTNILYVSAQSSDEQTLPHIRRDQITLTKFLGSGAFGEVFEGAARGLQTGDTKVAIKTLRTGASKREKNDFLKEAQLMSQFKHEHILQLLGVCLDNDPHFIIMELMQGGDLLTYLRSSRNPNSTTPPLTLLELLKMCVDVAKGCCYLEETHFVHRDLACRNCLVSSTDPAERIVKIGDFGLARDIYKNDYYRKEGEALLPIRWMAPESLLDGVFTCQSDVWAFGVLLWEIMTLGQQPYPAISNVEILRYLREGERLGKPSDCPDALYALMLKCWDAVPEERPTFKYCLGVLQQLHSDTCRKPITGAHEGQYISTVLEHCDGVSNEAYFRDENCNHSGSSWKSNETDSTPFLSQKSSSPPQPQQIPNYLELLYDDSDCPPENDGYEVPNKPDWNQKPQTPSTSSKACESAVVKTEVNGGVNSSFKNVINDLTAIENILKDGSAFTEKQDTTFTEECLKK